MKPIFQTQICLLKIFCCCVALMLLYIILQRPIDELREIEPNFRENLTHTSRASKEDIKSRYFVRSAQCAMPYVDPFSADVIRVFKPIASEKCSKDEYMVESSFDTNMKRYILHIREHVAANLSKKSDDFTCCYKQIIRKAVDDNSYDYLPCTIFHQDFVVPLHIEGITVECRSENSTKLLQQDAFTFIQIKNFTNPRHNGKNIRKPSVLLMGIDSLSRMNFKRNLVKTYEYIRKNNWYEMQGYNKMGDNTFPNIMAILTGYNEKSANEKCKPNQMGGLNNCPILWNDFKERGYHTAYAEDETWMSTFNFFMKGFQSPPTDYYLRPFIKAFEKNLEVKKRCGVRNCLGMRNSAEYVYDFAKEFGLRYINEPVFGIFWANTFSNNCYDTSFAVDDVMLKYWRDFEESGILGTSIVIFFSDHGMRWGVLTNLPDGFLEERLPMLFFWIPKWFALKYPQYVKALEANKNRLTSPYDLHMTLKHLLELASEEGEILPPAAGCPHCQSLFREVPINRNCTVAGIPENYCGCLFYMVIDTDELTKNITHLIIKEMNQYLVRRNFTEKCTELSLRSLNSAEEHINVEDVEDESDASKRLNEDIRKYRLKYHTNPNNSTFQATVIYYRQNNTITVDVETISRLNSYESDSKCVDDKQAKKYCICRNAIVKEQK